MDHLTPDRFHPRHRHTAIATFGGSRHSSDGWSGRPIADRWLPLPDSLQRQRRVGESQRAKDNKDPFMELSHRKWRPPRPFLDQFPVFTTSDCGLHEIAMDADRRLRQHLHQVKEHPPR
jgi:hypothetical protein